jgi:hypothetical protein
MLRGKVVLRWLDEELGKGEMWGFWVRSWRYRCTEGRVAKLMIDG